MLRVTLGAWEETSGLVGGFTTLWGRSQQCLRLSTHLDGMKPDTCFGDVLACFRHRAREARPESHSALRSAGWAPELHGPSDLDAFCSGPPEDWASCPRRG